MSSEQNCQVPVKSTASLVLNCNAGNEVKLQLYQVLIKLVPLETSKSGNEVSPKQSNQVPVKLVPLEVFNCGNEVSPEQSRQVLVKLVPLETSNCGNEVSVLQLNHAY